MINSMKNILRRCEQIVLINGEEFSVEDVHAVVPEYATNFQNHYYDGRKHYKSDGHTQTSQPCPDIAVEKIFENLPGIRMAKAQREIDRKHLENLKNVRR